MRSLTRTLSWNISLFSLSCRESTSEQVEEKDMVPGTEIPLVISKQCLTVSRYGIGNDRALGS